ncbi:MAG: VanW family protein [Bacillota bacterium]|nr:VanW family protein [Bacillota bacterium]
MRKNSQLMKLFIVLLICTAFIFSSSHFGAYAFEKSQKSSGKYIKGTSIGSLLIEGKSQFEASEFLQKKYADWIKNTTIFFQYGDNRTPIDLKLFHLDQVKTIDMIKNGQKTPVSIDIDSNKMAQQISLLFPQISSKDFAIDKLSKKMIEMASSLRSGNYTLNLFDEYLKTETNGIVSKTTMKIAGDSQELQLFLTSNSKIEIPAQSNFSLLDFLKNQKLEGISPETLSFIATAIYNVVLPTNFSINERDIGNTLPPYADLGFEAKLDPKQNLDLAFYNPNKGNYFLELNADKNNLMVSLTGGEFPYTYKMTATGIAHFAPKKIIQYSPILSPGQIKVTTVGVFGHYVKVYKDEYLGDAKMNQELVSEDYYSPVPTVEIHPLNSTSSESITTTSTLQTQQETQSSNIVQSSPTSSTQSDTTNESGTNGN